MLSFGCKILTEWMCLIYREMMGFGSNLFWLEFVNQARAQDALEKLLAMCVCMFQQCLVSLILRSCLAFRNCGYNLRSKDQLINGYSYLTRFQTRPQ